MKKIAVPLFCGLLALTACSTSSLTDSEKAPVPETTTEFSGTVKTIDKSRSAISFVGKSNIVNHESKFNDYSAEVTLDPAEPANLEKASVKAEIDLTSAETDAKGLDGHLKREDFFNVDVHPKATFVSTGIVRKEGNTYTISGDLTIKGVTKTITLDAEITDDYLTAEYNLPREEFGIGNNSYGQKLLEPMVPVTIKLVFAE